MTTASVQPRAWPRRRWWLTVLVVFTGQLGLIFGSNAALNDDHVDANDQPFLATFPYLAPLTP